MSRTIAAALAVLAVAAAPAAAKPADDGVRTSSLAGTPAPHQDLRGERARDTTLVAQPRQDLRGERAIDAATRPEGAAQAVLEAEAGFAMDPWPTPGARSVHAYAPPAAASTHATPGGGESPWLIIAIGLAGAATLIGAASLTRRHRVAT